MDLLLNDRLIERVFVERRLNMTQTLELKKGINELEFKIDEKCIRPIDVGEKDLRCLSVAVENIRLN